MGEAVTTVRLALSGEHSKDKRYAMGDDAALDGEHAVTTARLVAGQGMPMTCNALKVPVVRLAHVHGAQGDNSLRGRNGVEPLPDELRPGLLISFFYLDGWLKHQASYRYRDWIMDSGAFSAHNSGHEIDLNEYIDTAGKLLQQDPTLVEVYALDVIGDPEASLRNAEAMNDAGIAAIPTFHVGSAEHYLQDMASRYSKIALGGTVGYHHKLAWAKQCFARVWPKKVHGFGIAAESTIMALPWHSVDATDWELQPCGFGTWKKYGKVSVRGSSQNLRGEVEWYLDLERRAQHRWHKQMAQLDSDGRR